MTKLFSEFKAVTKKEWYSNIISNFKGVDFENKFISTSDNIRIYPFYHQDDKKDKFLYFLKLKLDCFQNQLL